MNNTMTSPQKMIVEVYRQTNLKELVNALNVPVGMMMVEGVLGRVDSENRNKRFYERAEYQKHIDLMSQRILESNGILGELEHPKSMNIDLNNASHKVMTIRLDEDGFVRGTVLLLDTPKGMIAQSVVRSGSPLPISSRAVGRVQENGSVKLDYMSTFDIVGIAGFQEAALFQPQRISESFDPQSGSLVSEMYEYDIDSNLDVIPASSMANIVESVKATLLESFIPTEEVNKLVEAKFEELKANYVNESQENNVSENQLVTLMNERFANVYSPIIESWITGQFAPKFGSTVQEWLANDYANVVESWIKEDVIPENAALTESWITGQFAPKLGESIQEWLINDHAQLVEGWLKSDFQANLVESLKLTPIAIVEAKVEEPIIEAKVEDVKPTINESAEIFKSKLLSGVDALINEAAEIATPVKQQTIQIDETNFIGAPSWLKMIPNEHKVLWQSMNESQKEQVYRRASVRILEDAGSIERFWKQTDWNSVMNVTESIKRDPINESLETPNINPLQASIIAQARALRS